MASVKFNRSDDFNDESFYYHFRIEVIQLIQSLEDIFTNYFAGVFEITVDEEQPRAGYIKYPGEEIDETLLLTNLQFLDKKMVEIVERINKLNTPWF
jgi:hypothetical protein